MEKGKKEEKCEGNITYAIRPYKLIAQVLGIWCLTCHNKIPKFQLTITCILLVTMAMSLLHELHPKCGVRKETLIPVSTAICCMLAVMKIMSIRLNCTKMRQVITSIVKDWSGIATSHDLEIMKDVTQIGRKLLTFQLVSSIIADVPMCLCGLGNSVIFNPTNNVTEIVKEIPLANPCFFKYIFFDFYIAIYFLQILQIIAVVIGNVGCDCYFFGITMQLVGQIQCFAGDVGRFEPTNCDLENQQILELLTRRHTHLLQMAKNLEQIFNAIIAFQVIANVYQICMGGLQILFSIRQKDGITAITFAFYTIIFLVQLAIYSYAGERLSSSISYVQPSFYGCPWYKMVPKARKDFIFIMTRSGKPFHLTAGKIILMNLESYKNIIKTLGSYFSVMQTMFDD